MDVWVLFVHRGTDYERDFAGVFETVTIDTLMQVGNPDTDWRPFKEGIYGYNPNWAVHACEFEFVKMRTGVYHRPAQYA
jgi:hypothetical protein